MGRAGMGSTHHAWPPGVTERRQIGQYPVRAPASQARDVLNHHPTRPALGDQSRHVGPEARTRTRDSGTTAGEADVLAGEAAAEHIRPGHAVGAESGGGESAYVVIDGYAGLVAAEGCAGARLCLAERDCLHAGPMEAEADAAKEVKESGLSWVHLTWILFLPLRCNGSA